MASEWGHEDVSDQISELQHCNADFYFFHGYKRSHRCFGTQLLAVTILGNSEDSIKELGNVTVSYSHMLAHADARSKGKYTTY